MPFTTPSQTKVLPIAYEICRPWLINVHYLQREVSTSYQFGLFEDQVLRGVITYGRALPMSVLNSPFGEDWSHCVVELNRLVLQGAQTPNAASFLIAKSIKQLPKPMVIISYADAGKGHIGYVYQASSFIYTGLSHTQKDWVLQDNPEIHSRTLMDEFAYEPNRIEKLKAKYGDRLIQVQRPPKHRYVRVHASRTDKRRLMACCRFDSLPYPKGDTKSLGNSSPIGSQMIMF